MKREFQESKEELLQAQSEDERREYLRGLSIADLLDYNPDGLQEFLVEQIIEQGLDL